MKNPYIFGYLPFVTILLFSLTFGVYTVGLSVDLFKEIGLYAGMREFLTDMQLRIFLLVIYALLFFMIFAALKLIAGTIHETAMLFFSKDVEGESYSEAKGGNVIYFFGSLVSAGGISSITVLAAIFLLTTFVYFIYVVYKLSKFMTIAIVGVGAILYVTMKRWQKLYDIQPQYLTLNALYDSAMLFGESGMNRLSRFYMTGLIRSYLLYMFAFIVAITTAALFIKEAFVVDMNSFSAVSVYGVLTAIILVIAVAMILLAKTRLAAIIALGAVGYSVALFFVIFKAPDLALTQLVIETISVALFLLAFQRLPKLNNHGETKPNKLMNLIISAGVGITVMLVALSAHSQKLIPSISQYYKDTVATEAGGGNIVNVILVDYRGFDTLFEIAVLSIAGIGVLAMIKLKLAKKEDTDENK